MLASFALRVEKNVWILTPVFPCKDFFIRTPRVKTSDNVACSGMDSDVPGGVPAEGPCLVWVLLWGAEC